MRRAATILCLVAAGGSLADRGVMACGDKPLVIGRHVRSQRAHGALHRGSILVLLDESGHLETAMREMSLRLDLELAGHSLRMVSTLDELVAEIHSGEHDVLIADISEAAALESILTAPGSPILIPAVINMTGDEWAEAAARLSCIRRSPSLGKHYLAVIEEAITQRRARTRRERGPRRRSQTSSEGEEGPR